MTTLSKGLLSVALAMALSGIAYAQDPAAAPVPTAAPPPPAPTPTGPSMKPAAQQLDSQTQELIRLQRQLELEQARQALLTTQSETGKLSGEVRGTSSGTSDLPVLVGLISKNNGVVWAEFLVGDAIMQVQPGGMVSSQWKLSKTLSNGVELVSRSGRERYTLLFGGGAMKTTGKSPRQAGTN